MMRLIAWKLTVLWILSGWITGCAPGPSSSGLSPYCPNQLALLYDSRANWEIPLDTLRTIQDYFVALRAERSKPYAINPIPDSLSFLNLDNDPNVKTITTFEDMHHPLVFPFITVATQRISLMQAIRSTGGGYFGRPLDAYRIYFRTYDDFITGFHPDSLANFYQYHIRQPIPKEFASNRIPYPRVDLVAIKDTINGVDRIIGAVARQYLNSMEELSQNEYGEELCSLSPENLSRLKARLPWRIRLQMSHSSERIWRK